MGRRIEGRDSERASDPISNLDWYTSSIEPDEIVSEESETCTMRVRDEVQFGLHLASMGVGDRSRTSMRT